jgi:hypothetical protein
LVLPAVLVGGILFWLLDMPFWWMTFSVLLASVVATNVWWWRKQKAADLKIIRDFPNPGDISSHYAEWKGENFDRLLSRYVHYARSANAIDETRKDFDRVGWGGLHSDASEKVNGIDRLMQWWFAGNHSDIGGSYAETESRLSDIALQWMIEQATGIRDGLKIGPVMINGKSCPAPATRARLSNCILPRTAWDTATSRECGIRSMGMHSVYRDVSASSYAARIGKSMFETLSTTRPCIRL